MGRPKGTKNGVRTICDVFDCELNAKYFGICQKHKRNMDRFGVFEPSDPAFVDSAGRIYVKPPGRPVGKTHTAEERFWKYVNKAGPIGIDHWGKEIGNCWLWTGAIWGRGGHGQFHVDGPVYAHRFSYELNVGAIPEGLIIDHLCNVPRCVRPLHLEAVTYGENVHRGHIRKKVGYSA